MVIGDERILGGSASIARSSGVGWRRSGGDISSFPLLAEADSLDWIRLAGGAAEEARATYI